MLLFILLFLFINVLIAHNEHFHFRQLLVNNDAKQHIRCIADELVDKHLQNNPDQQKKRSEVDSFVNARLDASAFNMHFDQDITIPVFVHIGYYLDVENLSNEQIQSQIDVLNEDYNKQNDDWMQTPDEFIDRVANFHIKFTWNSNNINRLQLDTETCGMDDSIKSLSPKQSGFLNIWVCNIGDKQLGYAYFPGTVSDDLDGLVITSGAFGSIDYDINNNFYFDSDIYNKGRTATHEIGHWLNLLHIWGNTDECEEDDYVKDTPESEEPYMYCPTYPQYSCKNSNMFMNYMDYTQDDCMYMFTKGQKLRARALFEPGGYRAEFVASTTTTSTTSTTKSPRGCCKPINNDNSCSTYTNSADCTFGNRKKICKWNSNC